MSCDAEIVERIDRAIGRSDDHAELGSLFVARALALQCRGSASAPAAAARSAIPHLVAANELQSAAFASAMAAVFSDQTDQTVAAVDHAIDALVMLGDRGSADALFDFHGARAALGLSGFFLRFSAIDLAVDMAGRAFRSASVLDDIPRLGLAYTVGYVSAEGAHMADDEQTRHRCVTQAAEPIEWLQRHSSSHVGRVLMADGLRAEIRHACGTGSDDIDIARGIRFYADAPPDIVAWHRLVCGASALRRGDASEAIAFFDEAIPGLEASADNHCLVRAFRERAEARALSGDHEGAYADAAELAARTRGWQISQVGRLAFQLARRADLERSTTELERTVARLANDIDNDAMTGVRSRRWLERRLDDMEREDEWGAVIMCDVDRFKHVNDTYGHHVGDAVLRQFGGLLEHVTGVTDIARFGGEEFVVILSGVDQTDAVEMAERLRHAVERHDWSHVAPGLHLTVSCGVTHGSLGDVRSLLVAADDALLDAKHRGRNLVMTPSSTTAH